MINKTQSHILISEIKEGVALLKDGGAVIVLKVSAVNFGLLSGEEQMAIIGSFAQMLNSLSFAIQIVILSKRLDISSYIALLDKELKLQTNPLLAQTMVRYRQFVQSLIKENEVLDKSFYVAVPVSRLELSVGVLKGDELLKKAKTKILPRRDQIARQLNRVGLKVSQLNDKDLIELFYYIYNPSETRISSSALDDKIIASSAYNPQGSSAVKIEVPREIRLNIPQPVHPVPQPCTLLTYSLYLKISRHPLYSKGNIRRQEIIHLW